jgi:hypothetical protein
MAQRVTVPISIQKVLRAYLKQSTDYSQLCSDHLSTCQVTALRYAMAASFHVLPNSIFTIVKSVDAIDSKLHIVVK